MSQTLTALASVALPCVLPTPQLRGFLSTQTTGGSIAASTTVSYRVSALVGTTETAASPNMTTTTGSGTSTNLVIVSWLPIAGATSYKVYGRTPGAELLIATVTAPYTTYTDTGSITPAGAYLTTSQFVEATAAPGLYQVPANVKQVTIKGLRISNPTLFTGQVFLSRVKIGGLTGANARFIGGAYSRPDAIVTTADIREPNLNLMLNGNGAAAGDYLSGYATVPGLVLHLDGLVTA